MTAVVKNIIVLDDFRRKNKRTRLVGTINVGDVLDGQRKQDGWQCSAYHGGTVANAYKYATTTQCVGWILSPRGELLIAYGEIPANKATNSGAARATLAVLAPLFDGRGQKGARSEQEAWRAAKVLHARYFDRATRTIDACAGPAEADSYAAAHLDQITKEAS